MTLTKQVKILDGEVKANKAQYDVDSETAKISAGKYHDGNIV